MSEYIRLGKNVLHLPNSKCLIIVTDKEKYNNACIFRIEIDSIAKPNHYVFQGIVTISFSAKVITDIDLDGNPEYSDNTKRLFAIQKDGQHQYNEFEEQYGFVIFYYGELSV